METNSKCPKCGADGVYLGTHKGEPQYGCKSDGCYRVWTPEDESETEEADGED